MLKIYEYSTPNKLLSHDNKLEMLQSGYGWDEELFIYKSDTTSSITSNITPQIGSIIAIKLTDFAYPYAFLVQDVDENNKISLLNVGYNLWGETEIPPIQLGKSLKSIIDYLTDENFIRYNVIFAYSGIDNIKYTYRMTVVTKILDIVERLTKQFNIFVTSYIKDDALNIKFEIGASQQYKLQTNITHDVSIETNLTDSQIANFVTTYLDDKFYKMYYINSQNQIKEYTGQTDDVPYNIVTKTLFFKDEFDYGTVVNELGYVKYQYTFTLCNISKQGIPQTVRNILIRDSGVDYETKLYDKVWKNQRFYYIFSTKSFSRESGDDVEDNTQTDASDARDCCEASKISLDLKLFDTSVEHTDGYEVVTDNKGNFRVVFSNWVTCDDDGTNCTGWRGTLEVRGVLDIGKQYDGDGKFKVRITSATVKEIRHIPGDVAVRSDIVTIRKFNSSGDIIYQRTIEDSELVIDTLEDNPIILNYEAVIGENQESAKIEFINIYNDELVIDDDSTISAQWQNLGSNDFPPF